MKFDKLDLVPPYTLYDLMVSIVEGKTELLRAWTMLKTSTDISDALEEIDECMREILVTIGSKE